MLHRFLCHFVFRMCMSHSIAWKSFIFAWHPPCLSQLFVLRQAIVSVVKSACKAIVCDLVILIEGKQEDELPERIIGATRSLANLDSLAASQPWQPEFQMGAWFGVFLLMFHFLALQHWIWSCLSAHTHSCTVFALSMYLPERSKLNCRWMHPSACLG